jgi:hypothetical protein
MRRYHPRVGGQQTLKIIPLILLMAISCPVAYSQPRHSSNSKPVKGSGCVEQAVENSCHVIIDSQSGELYNLLFPAKVPKSGTAIKFTGTKHSGATSCMQGKPIKVSTWKIEKGIKCPPPVYAQLGR